MRAVLPHYKLWLAISGQLILKFQIRENTERRQASVRFCRLHIARSIPVLRPCRSTWAVVVLQAPVQHFRVIRVLDQSNLLLNLVLLISNVIGILKPGSRDYAVLSWSGYLNIPGVY
jgi:hypothetical protein